MACAFSVRPAASCARASAARVAAVSSSSAALGALVDGEGRAPPEAGLVGEVVCKGPLGPLLPVLRAAELVHVSKGTSHGLGRVRVVEG